MRVAVAGTGRMGAFRAQVLAEHPGVETVVVGSRNEGRALELVSRLGCEWSPLDELLDREPDAVVISTETPAHAHLIAECAERSLPVLCEKPIAVGLDDTREAIRRAAAAGIVLQVAFQRRFDPGFVEVRRLARAGRLGVLYAMRLVAHDHEPSPEYYIPTSGRIWRDLHVHDFDLARWMTGQEVERVFAYGTVRAHERFAKHDDFDTTAAVLTMTDGMVVSITGARHDPRGYDFRLELFGSADSVAAGLDERAPLRFVDLESRTATPEAAYRGFLDRFAEAFRRETHAFADVARGRRENPCPGEAALEATRVALACERSADEGRPVAVAEVDAPARI
jgi:myo-inositol 2-dehydrogenase / D-chiro-inositol 1-dehydrogenase